MREFQERKQRKQRIYSKWSLLGLLVLAILMTKGVISVYGKEHATRMELDRLAKQQADIEARYNNISSEAARLQTDVGIETEIRQRFDVAKKGEGVIVVVDKELPAPEPQKGFVRRVWDSVTGIFR